MEETQDVSREISHRNGAYGNARRDEPRRTAISRDVRFIIATVFRKDQLGKPESRWRARYTIYPPTQSRRARSLDWDAAHTHTNLAKDNRLNEIMHRGIDRIGWMDGKYSASLAAEGEKVRRSRGTAEAASWGPGAWNWHVSARVRLRAEQEADGNASSTSERNRGSSSWSMSGAWRFAKISRKACSAGHGEISLSDAIS